LDAALSDHAEEEEDKCEDSDGNGGPFEVMHCTDSFKGCSVDSDWVMAVSDGW